MTRNEWDVLDWRRRTAAIYREVRAAADPAEGHARWVADRNTMLAAHPASPVPIERREAYRGAAVAPYDPRFRFVVPVDWDVPVATRHAVTGTDGVVELRRVGRIAIDDLGSLDVWWVAVYGGGILLPVRDATSGTASYGGGRYLLDTVKGADLGGDAEGLVVDFNFAYQPSCAYDERWACPLPGPENRLAAPLPVGEQYVP